MKILKGRCRWEDNVKINSEGIWWKDLPGIQ
jgi:hypothetical protein